MTSDALSHSFRADQSTVQCGRLSLEMRSTAKKDALIKITQANPQMNEDDK